VRNTHLSNIDLEQLKQYNALFFKNFDNLVERQRYTEVPFLDSFEDIIAGKARFFAVLSLLNIAAHYIQPSTLVILKTL